MGSNTDTAELCGVEILRESLRAASHRPLSQVIYEELRRQILRGEVPTGYRFVEERLASALGASRTPVREALQRLAQEELLMKLRYGGYEVRKITEREIQEIFGIRSVLESYAAVLATRNMDSKVMQELEEIIGRSRKAMERRDVEAFIFLNTEFHDTLYRASGSERLYRMIQELRDHFYRFRKVILSKGEMPKISLRDHEAMIEAMKQKQDKRVERLVRQHILRGMEVVMKAFKKGEFLT